MVDSYPAILVVSHGPMCAGLIESTKMIFGNVNRIEALPLDEDADVDEYYEALEALIAKYEENVFIVCDIVGGTPFNTLMKLSRKHRLHGVSGASIPLLIEVLANREEMDGDELAHTVAANVTMVPIDLSPILEKAFNTNR